MVDDNPGYDPMEIVEAELDWEVGDDGSLIELSSGLRHYYISEHTRPILDVCSVDGSGLASRECRDLRHAFDIAEAFEREAKRNIRRGCTWHGKQIDAQGLAVSGLH